jgi:hypothetical protein
VQVVETVCKLLRHYLEAIGKELHLAGMPQQRFSFLACPQRPPGTLIALLGPFPAKQMAFLAKIETSSSSPLVLFPANILQLQ